MQRATILLFKWQIYVWTGRVTVLCIRNSSFAFVGWHEANKKKIIILIDWLGNQYSSALLGDMIWIYYK